MDEILESDYSEDLSDEEYHAGGYGGYDVIQAGYDPWLIALYESGIDIAEHNFDEEWPLFIFDREIGQFVSQRVIKPGIEIMEMEHNEKGIFLASISYAQVLRYAMKCQEMCEAWRVRRNKKIVSKEEINRTLDRFPFKRFSDWALNLHQFDISKRQLMRDYSVYRLVECLGDESNVDIFFKEISTSLNLLKSILFIIIRSCLPPMLSSTSPVVDQVLENLIVSKGLDYIGFVSQEESRQLVEAKYLTSLCEELEALYGSLRDVMFLPNPDIEIHFVRRTNFRALIYVLGKFLDEEIMLEDGGWTQNPDWEKDLIELNNATEEEIKAFKDLFKFYTCIFN